MTAVVRYPTKKALREQIGKPINVVETSIFGPEYPPGGTGRMYVVGPSETERKYYAQIQLKNHILTYVK